MLGKDGAPIYSSPALVQNSQTTCALLDRWRDYPEKCRSKPVISRTKLADNSCNTSIRQLVRCHMDVVAIRRNVVINLSYLGIMQYYFAACHTGLVITRTMSPWPTGGSEHKNRRNVYDNLRLSYEKSPAHFRCRVLASMIFKLFKNLVGSS